MPRTAITTATTTVVAATVVAATGAITVAMAIRTTDLHVVR
jgi:hypothetical protein